MCTVWVCMSIPVGRLLQRLVHRTLCPPNRLLMPEQTATSRPATGERKKTQFLSKQNKTQQNKACKELHPHEVHQEFSSLQRDATWHI